MFVGKLKKNMGSIETFTFIEKSMKNLLESGESDIIEWENGMVKEYWEDISFIANGKMKSANELWNENKEKILNWSKEVCIGFKERTEYSPRLHVYFLNKLEEIIDDYNVFMLKYDLKENKNTWFFEALEVVYFLKHNFIYVTSSIFI